MADWIASKFIGDMITRGGHAGTQVLQRCQGFSLRGEQARVFGDADHGEDLGEMWGETEGVDFLAGVGRFHEELDDERDAAGVDVIDLGEIEEDQFDSGFGQRLICAQYGLLGGAGDIPLKAEDAYRVPGRGSELVN